MAGSVRSGSGYAIGLTGGGGGTTNHAALSNLTWTVSAHIGTAGSLALFDGAGAAAYLTGVTQGDVLYFDGTNWNRLPPGTAGEFLQTQGAGANPVWAPAGGGAATLQSAYNAGNTIVTAGATDIALTLSSGGLNVQGTGAVSFGSVSEVSSFSVFSSGTAALQSRDTTNVNMQASNAAPRSLTVSATNALGDANLVFSQDTRALFTSAQAETSSGWRFTQSGAGGDSADLFVGTSDPSGAISAQAASLFLRDTGAGAEIYLNTSAGSGTTWSQLGTGGSGITAAQHAALRQLIHFLDDGPGAGFASGAYKEIQYSGALITQEIWWEDNTKTQKIVQLDVTYTGSLPTTEVWQMYDTDGVTVLVTLTDVITYNGSLETTRTRTWV
jgi:hypothetical protein